MTTAAYLARLGLPAGLPPTYESLVAIHRAHLLLLPYDNLGIMLGAPPSADPDESLERLVATGRAGYCFHQNGALGRVLADLGYDVRRRFGHVWTRPEHRGGPELNHLVLVVSGLPTDTNPDGVWSPDVGLGEGPLDPVPVVDGPVDDGPFRFGVRDADAAAGTWTFVNDPRGSFVECEVRDEPTGPDVVGAAHVSLSTPPSGAFATKLVVQRRDPHGCDTVRGCVVTRVDADGVHTRDVTTYADWRAALAAIGLAVDDVDAVALRDLFDRSLAAHEAWLAEGRP